MLCIIHSNFCWIASVEALKKLSNRFSKKGISQILRQNWDVKRLLENFRMEFPVEISMTNYGCFREFSDKEKLFE